MKNATVIFAIAALTAILAVSCQTALSGMPGAYKQSPNMDDPNMDDTQSIEGENPDVESLIVRSQEAVRQPSSAVTVVRFCKYPGYKSAFPTTGICLRKKVLYAQIGNDKGLYTLIKPGRYSANATGSPCSFTVGKNCEISK